MKYLSYLIVAVISIVAAILLVDLLDSPTSKHEYVSSSQSETIDVENSENVYYSQLTESQRALYDILVEPISKGEQSIVINNVDLNKFKTDVDNVTVAIHYDKPEYFWYGGGYKYTVSIKGDDVTAAFEPGYYSYVTPLFDSASKSSQLQTEVKKVAELAKKHSEKEYERMLFVHDYLIENAIYDSKSAEEYFKTTGDPSCEYIFSAYGCLVNKKTVCSGYAKAYQLIMNELGYKCAYVTGEAGEPHGWNCVWLDNEAYYVDVTWDNHDFEKEVPFYDYAFVTEEELTRTHTIDMIFDEPECNAEKYDFFLYHNFYLEKYDFHGAMKVLASQTKNEAAYIQFGTYTETLKAYTDLVTNGKSTGIHGMDNFTKVFLNQYQNTISFYKQ